MFLKKNFQERNGKKKKKKGPSTNVAILSIIPSQNEGDTKQSFWVAKMAEFSSKGWCESRLLRMLFSFFFFENEWSFFFEFCSFGYKWWRCSRSAIVVAINPKILFGSFFSTVNKIAVAFIQVTLLWLIAQLDRYFEVLLRFSLKFRQCWWAFQSVFCCTGWKSSKWRISACCFHFFWRNLTNAKCKSQEQKFEPEDFSNDFHKQKWLNIALQCSTNLVPCPVRLKSSNSDCYHSNPHIAKHYYCWGLRKSATNSFP